jgi:hypothetical protein
MSILIEEGRTVGDLIRICRSDRGHSVLTKIGGILVEFAPKALADIFENSLGTKPDEPVLTELRVMEVQQPDTHDFYISILSVPEDEMRAWYEKRHHQREAEKAALVPA